MFSKSIALLATLSAALAAVTPTSPDGSTVVKVGDNITALWSSDTTGQWKQMEIQLMTGPNLDMVALSVLGQNIDGTSTTSFSAPAPDVSPYSQIYFLQFTNGGDASTATWSTRFTIAGADGSTTDPTNTTVWNGESVKWGTGVLASGSDTSGSSTNSSSSTSTNAAVASSSSSASTSGSGSMGGISMDSNSNSASASKSASGSASMSSTSSKASASHSGAASRGAKIGGGAMLLALAGWLL